MGVIALLAGPPRRVSPQSEDRGTADAKEMERKKQKIAFIVVSIILSSICLVLFLAFVGFGEFSSADG